MSIYPGATLIVLARGDFDLGVHNPDSEEGEGNRNHDGNGEVIKNDALETLP